MTTQEKVQVANTILAQMGGNKFLAMTGTKDLVALNTDDYQFGGLRMRISKNNTPANILIVTLNSMDTYDVVFQSVRIGKTFSVKTVKEYNMVYGDMLQRIFTDATGLYTRL